MFTLLLLSVSADPTFIVENKIPPAFAVVNRLPAKAESDYEAILRRVMAGETVITDTIPGEPRGKYRCFLEGGKPVYKKIEAAPAVAGYPIRGNWWSGCGSWQHLTSGEHAGKFPASWLQTLSNAEIQSLHSDDHEGRVKWQYVPKVKSKIVADPFCPSGT